MMFVTTGRTCSVDFPTELIACDDGGIVLKSSVSSNVDESCRHSQAGSHLPMAEHHLIRSAAPVSPKPIGVPDAGVGPPDEG